MARKCVRDIDAYMRVANWTLLTVPPFTMAAWVQRNTSRWDTFIGLGNTSTTQEWHWVRHRGGTPNLDWHQMFSQTGATTAASLGPGVTTIDKWHHGCGVYASISDRTMYTDGVKGTQNTTDTAEPTGIDLLAIGAGPNEDVATVSGSDVTVAEAAIWSVALSDSQVASLAAGVCPLRIEPLNLKGYWPIFGVSDPEPDLSGFGNNATLESLNGLPALADHPPVQPMFGYDSSNFDPGAAVAAERRVILIG